MTVLQAAAWLMERDNFLILTHLRPDGDTIGCAAALCRCLRQQGKCAVVLPNKQATALFLPDLEGLLAPEDWTPDTVVSVDVAALGLFPQNALPYLDRIDLAIDHHPSQEFFARETCLDAGRAACGELVYDIVSQLATPTVDVATALYVAISTDCGCFVYGNTNAATHRAAAALIDCGFPLAALNKRHFRTKSIRRMKLEASILANVALHQNGKIAIACISLDLMRALGADEQDLDDIAALVGQLEGVNTSVTIRELGCGQCKLSLRTNPNLLNASRVCALLGGGGHAAASGATMNGTLEQAKAAILDAIAQIQRA
jgi:phosphoesterase RecJ-like protein